MVKYALFLGCQIPMRIPSVEIASRRVFERIGLETVDLKGYSCCPEPIISRLLDKTGQLAVSARNLALAEELGLDIMTLCNGCYETLLEANETLKHESEEMLQINKILENYGKKYRGLIKVKHVVEVLYEDIGVKKIRECVIKPLKIRVAMHYGCHLYRDLSGDIMRKPEMMKKLTSLTGVEIVDYGLERLCCGYPSMQVDEKFSLTHRLLPKIEKMIEAGAEAVVLTCPACTIQFETGQVLLKEHGIQYDLPCINIVELLALSFGFSSRDLHLELHRGEILRLIKKVEGN